MNVCFITRGGREWASSRMRAYWVADAMPAKMTVQTIAEITASGTIAEADAYVFQKTVDTQLAANLRARGSLVVWDVCDPSWWWEPGECAKFLPLLSGVTASNKAHGRIPGASQTRQTRQRAANLVRHRGQSAGAAERLDKSRTAAGQR